MDYNQTLEWLYGQLPMFSRTGGAAYKPGLDTSLRLDKFFGHPHRRFKSIHVGGTNGKGSCSHIIAAALQAQGYKVGLYTSPHLVDFRERMRINGDMIPRDSVTDFVRRFLESDYDGHPSFFELTMMMAFDWFASEKVDYAVIEVGMGGRLDSTNIITPVACVITNISEDHTQFLGDTLPKIAGEKAGIIKAGVPVTVGESEGDVREVFRTKAEEVGTEITFADDEAERRRIVRSEADGGWDGTTEDGISFHSPLGGEYQRRNINTVCSAFNLLRRAGIALSDQAIARGFSDVLRLTGLCGRWTRLQETPEVIADTGHNLAGITYNMQQLCEMRERNPQARLKMVIGFVADKAIDEILPLFPKDADYYFTAAGIPRALGADKLASKAAEHGLTGRIVPKVIDAYRKALASCSPEDILYVGGSTFVVADLLRDLRKEADL